MEGGKEGDTRLAILINYSPSQNRALRSSLCDHLLLQGPCTVTAAGDLCWLDLKLPS